MVNSKDIINRFAHYHDDMITCIINDNNDGDKKHVIKDVPNNLNKVAIRHS